MQMNESEFGYIPELENSRHLPIHEKWIFNNDPDETAVHIQRFNYLLDHIQDNWLTKEQQETVYQKFNKEMMRLENANAHGHCEIKISANHAMFTVSIAADGEAIAFQERNHFQKL